MMSSSLDRFRVDERKISELPATVECVWPAKAILGEGCCWDSRSRRLFFVDIKGARLYALTPSTGTREIWDLPCRIGSVAVPPVDWQVPAALEGEPLLACGDMGLMWLGLRPRDVEIIVIADPESHLPENRFNDGKIGPDGRYWAGTMHDPETRRTGSLYAFSKDGQVEVLDGNYRVPNGPAFSSDGRVVYHTDSADRTVYAFDLGDGGRITGKRVFLQFAPSDGHPDGMTTDAAGNLWIAMWDGSRLEKLSPHGKRIGHVEMPTPRPTSCTFAEDGETSIYVTSARVGLSDPDACAGGLFKVSLAS
jgi:sugar lactone lactonase YvrE